MKRSIIIVIVFSVGLLVTTSLIGMNFLQYNNADTLSFGDVEISMRYTVNFEYCKLHPGAQNHISINIIDGKIYFEQVLNIYCNAADDIFWLELTGNNSIIKILDVFEPNGVVARCICPIKISGVLGDFTDQSFTLEFILVNNYVYQNHTLDSFSIKI
ncbi:MAG: hypothetical protein ACFFDW_02855 [Candidatus Thorarchaeota archaeon]